jgi:RNA polymerase sigma-70 factor, ECF subfamily
MNPTHTRQAAPSAEPQPRLPAAGGELDFVKVLGRFEAPLLRYVAHLLGPGTNETQDVVQEAFIRLHRHVRQHGTASIRQISTWLYRVAHNLAIDAVRRRTVRRELAVGQEALNGAMDRKSLGETDAFDMLNELARREAGDRAMAELGRLPEPQRSAIMLKVVQGMTMREIGQVMGTTPSNVCYHLNQGLAALAERLKQQGVI